MRELKLREPQSRGISLLKNEWHKCNSFLLYAPVGYGKTEIAVFISKGMVRNGLSVLFIAPFSTLVFQTHDRFTSYGVVEPGYIKGDMPVNHFHQSKSAPLSHV